MRIKRNWLLVVTIMLLCLSSGSIFTRAGSVASADDREFRWDIVVVGPTLTVDPGGQASARAEDGSQLTVTGSGTFRDQEDSNNVTGGGTWKTTDPSGNVTGTGTYRAVRVVRFDEAPGTLPSPPFTDNIADNRDARGGLLVLKISYSDGSNGILIVSCHIAGTPDSVFEGITASKSFVDFWNHTSGNTLFHVLRN